MNATENECSICESVPCARTRNRILAHIINNFDHEMHARIRVSAIEIVFIPYGPGGNTIICVSQPVELP